DDELQTRGKHDALLSLSERLRAERTLHDVLVEAPVEEIRYPEPDDKRGPRNGRIIRRTDHVQLPAFLDGSAIEQGESLDRTRVGDLVRCHASGYCGGLCEHRRVRRTE